ncbi:alpha-phosphoglucomutase [Natranaerovirga pectinivora]|uniref:Phosphoglucomutase n=1 Tax=Natranaerovirga pectinivora TaxID=682400 RepID=A0A4R3MP41_9FIRM|nr:phospho-sugar mutase [Natranaerovirga pectinivora]TCT13948.1 alpha-phosphoglucomutase [Natranaerovirga pectinivora]
MKHLEIYNEWINDAYFDEETKGELLQIKDENEIKERFYKELEFGTGGLRGIIGPGTNRINIYTIRKATQGLANYIIKQGKEAVKKGVAIAYDSRYMSYEFALETALVLNGNGIKTFMFDTLKSTPELSFATRQLGCVSGVVITASHNPPEYNGYKVYWDDGAQVTSPKDIGIIKEVNAIKSFKEVNRLEINEAKKKGLYNIIGKDMDELYIGELKKLILNQEAINQEGDNLKIVYTPLHGTGNIPVQRILNEVGFSQVYVVPEQAEPDSNFSTVGYPNPEDMNVYTLAIDLARKTQGDIILATDPDADRIGVLVKGEEEYIPLTGNMLGVLIADYILTKRIENSDFPSNGALIKTIVSTNMINEVAKYYGVTLIEVLTGFKYIGEKIKEFEQTGDYTYLFGFEESYGYLIGTHARDKDAIVATMTLCEIAAYYKTKGLTLWEGMLSLYEKYGYFKETQQSITLKGIDGIEKMNTMLKELRNNQLSNIGNNKVLSTIDYLNEKATGLPKSNVLYFELENNGWVCVRPSGTEPKVKIYFGIKGISMEDTHKKLNDLQDDFMKIMENK